MEKKFLVLTAISKYWDNKASKLLFVEDGCYVSKNSNIETDDIVEDKKNETISGFLDEMNYVEQEKIRMKEILINTLNRYHNVKYSKEAWDIFLYYWFDYYVEIMYTKYNLLKTAAIQSVYTNVLDKSMFQHPGNGGDFLNFILKSDEYNLQLYSEIVEFLNIEIKESIKYAKLDSKINLKALLKRKLGNLFNYIINIPLKYAENIVVNPKTYNFKLKEKFNLMKHRVGFLYLKGCSDETWNYNVEQRNKFKNLLHSNNLSEFEELLLSTIAFDIPCCYIEQFSKITSIAKRMGGNSNKIIFSAEEWHTIDLVKFFVGISKEKNVKLHTIKIGGNGDLYCNVNETTDDIKMSDVLYTSGWKTDEKECISKIMTNPRTWNAKKHKKITSKNIDILYVGNQVFPYKGLYSNFYSFREKKYVSETIKFLSEMKEKREITLKARTCKVLGEKGWNLSGKLEELNIACDDYNIPFTDSIQKCNLVILDVLDTTWMEVLVMDIPFIVIIPKDFHFFSKKGNEVVAYMRKVGIFYDDYSEVLNIIVQKCCNVESWWESPEVIKVRSVLKSQYAYCAKDPISEWIENFSCIDEEI